MDRIQAVDVGQRMEKRFDGQLRIVSVQVLTSGLASPDTNASHRNRQASGPIADNSAERLRFPSDFPKDPRNLGQTNGQDGTPGACTPRTIPVPATPAGQLFGALAQGHEKRTLEAECHERPGTEVVRHRLDELLDGVL